VDETIPAHFHLLRKLLLCADHNEREKATRVAAEYDDPDVAQLQCTCARRVNASGRGESLIERWSQAYVDADAESRSSPTSPSSNASITPHSIHTLQLHGSKNLLRKTRIIMCEAVASYNGTYSLGECIRDLLIRNGSKAVESDQTGKSNHSASKSSRSFMRLKSNTASSPFSTSSLRVNALASLETLHLRLGLRGVYLADGLAHNTSIRHLLLSNNAIHEDGCEKLCRVLARHPRIESLDLSMNILYDSCGSILRDLLTSSRTLTSLDVSVNKLHGEGIATLMQALGADQRNATLIREWVEKNSAIPTSRGGSTYNTPSASPTTQDSPLSSVASSPPLMSASAFLAMAPGPGSIPSTHAHRRLPSHVLPLLPFVDPQSPPQSHSQSQSHHPSSNGHTSGNVHINTTLRTLKIGNNHLGCNDLQPLGMLASALVAPNGLDELSMNLNDIGDTGAIMLSLALRHPSCRLKSLDLSDNMIQAQGCKTILQAIHLNNAHTRITNLDLSWNGGALGVGGQGEGSRALGSMLRDNVTLTKLSLVGTGMNESGVRAMVSGWMDAVASGKSQLRHLNLSVNPLCDNGIRELSTVLAHPCCPLQHLHLNRVQMLDAGCSHLTAALTIAARSSSSSSDATNSSNLSIPSPSLLRIKLLGNYGLHPPALAALMDAYTKHPALIELDLDDHPLIARDEVLCTRYRRSRIESLSVIIGVGASHMLPSVLCREVAEFVLDIRRKHATIPKAAKHTQTNDNGQNDGSDD